MINGFAVELDGVIQMPTVGPSEQSAQVNGLVVHFGVPVCNGWTSAQIEAAWESYTCRAHPEHVVCVVPVTVAKAKCN